jgi:hypothetical protein
MIQSLCKGLVIKRSASCRDATWLMLLLSFLALVSLSVSRTVASSTVHQKLVALAATGGGVIKLNSTSFDLITAANRNWSASIVFTSLDPRNSCEPCKSVPIIMCYPDRMPDDSTGDLRRRGQQSPKRGPKFPRRTAIATSSG